jgi:hypothetical protein
MDLLGTVYHSEVNISNRINNVLQNALSLIRVSLKLGVRGPAN